jgi:hypothetical protein
VLTLDTSGGEVRQVAAVTTPTDAAPPPPVPQAVYLPPPVPGGEVRQARAVVAAPAPRSRSVDAPRRRAFVDLTAQPWFGHGDDHSWLNGQVQYLRSANTWRLHYASVDDNDPYGGTVTLVGDDALRKLKDGQYVRVCGSPVEPDRREAGSPYRVTSFEVVAHPQ